MGNELKQMLADVQAMTEKLNAVVASSERKAANTNNTRFTPSHQPQGDEYKAMKAFGCNSIPHLIQINTEHPKFKSVPEYYKGLVRQLKETVDISRYIAQVFHGGEKDRIGNIESQDHVARCKNITDSYYAKENLVPRLKAFGSTTGGAGDEWVPTLMSANYIEEFQLAHVLESRFRRIQMLSNPFEQPTQTGLNKARIIAENSQLSETQFTTGKLTFTATKLGESAVLPEEMTEDSAPDAMAAAREYVITSQVRGVESATINGDNDGTHIDSDTQAGGADLAEKAWKGLRRQAIANSANGGTTSFAAGAATETGGRTMRARMGKFGSLPDDLLWIAGPIVYQQMQAFDGVYTVEKYGPNATVLKGALSAWQGIPIINSEHMREDLNASGVYDGVSTDKGGLLLVNLRRWLFGERRPIRVQAMVDLPYYDRFLLASYQRKDFQGFAQSATEVSVSYGIDIAV